MDYHVNEGDTINDIILYSEDMMDIQSGVVYFSKYLGIAHGSGCFLFGQTDATDHAITEPECTGQGQSRTIRTVGRWMAAGGPRA